MARFRIVAVFVLALALLHLFVPGMRSAPGGVVGVAPSEADIPDTTPETIYTAQLDARLTSDAGTPRDPLVDIRPGGETGVVYDGVGGMATTSFVHDVSLQAGQSEGVELPTPIYASLITISARPGELATVLVMLEDHLWMRVGGSQIPLPDIAVLPLHQPFLVDRLLVSCGNDAGCHLAVSVIGNPSAPATP